MTVYKRGELWDTGWCCIGLSDKYTTFHCEEKKVLEAQMSTTPNKDKNASMNLS